MMKYGERRETVNIVLFMLAFLASVIGSLCGIGGGVLMKPLIDMFNLADASVASFLSACTVFIMSLYNVSKRFQEGSKDISLQRTLPLALGAAGGGVLGNRFFSVVCYAFSVNVAGAVQAVCLMLLTFGTMVYTINKEKIRTKQVTSKVICVTIGLALGMLSSFLGIGGGPFNIAVLNYFFSMGTKIAVANSLFVILISQTANLASSALTGSVPDVSLWLVVLMALGGISGGVVGRKLNKKFSTATIDKWFIGLLAVIVGICIYNGCKWF